MDRYSMSREFEAVKMKAGVQGITDVKELQKIACTLIDLNMGMKQQVAEWAKIGWAPEQ